MFIIHSAILCINSLSIFCLFEGGERKSWGDIYLYFGCRRSGIDNIYRKELEQAQAEGVIKKVYIALSRQPDQPKVGHYETLLTAELLSSTLRSVLIFSTCSQYTANLCSILSVSFAYIRHFHTFTFLASIFVSSSGKTENVLMLRQFSSAYDVFSPKTWE